MMKQEKMFQATEEIYQEAIIQPWTCSLASFLNLIKQEMRETGFVDSQKMKLVYF